MKHEREIETKQGERGETLLMFSLSVELYESVNEPPKALYVEIRGYKDEEVEGRAE